MRYPDLICLVQAVRDFWDLLKPGGKLHPTYIIEHQGHLVFEVVLTVVIAYLLFQRSYKPSAKQEKPLTEKVRIFCVRRSASSEKQTMPGAACRCCMSLIGGLHLRPN